MPENTVRKEELCIKSKVSSDTNVNLSDYLEYSASANIPIMNVSDLMEEYTQNQKTNDTSFQEIKIVKSDEPQKNDNISELKYSLRDLDDMAKSQAITLADKISDEINRFWTRKSAIRSTLSAIDRKNAYSFIRSMLNVSESRTVLGDIKNFISYTELKHLILAILKQADDVGAGNTFLFRQLKKEYDNVVKVWSRSPGKKPDNKTINTLNKRIEDLFEEMSKQR